MKRNTFILITAILAALFGLSMLLAPDQMLKNMTSGADPSAHYVLQWAGCMLLSIAIMNFISRNDAGSPALRAVMIGNIVMHALGLAVDFYQYMQGFIITSGLASGLVVHLLIIAGFAYYLRQMGRA
jgi:hypothetical protein